VTKIRGFQYRRYQPWRTRNLSKNFASPVSRIVACLDFKLLTDFFSGRIERYMAAKHSSGVYNNVGVSAFYTTSSPLDVQHLQSFVYRAVKDVVADHPALGASIADDDKPRPYYVQLPTIDLSKAVTFISSNTITDPSDPEGAKALDLLLEEQHNNNFENRAPQDALWRLFIVHEPAESSRFSRFVACFVYHHAICDGTSGLAFHRHLRRKLSQSPANNADQKADVIVTTSSKTFLPALEELHPLPLSTRFLLKAICKEYIAGNKPKRRIWTAAPTTSDPSKRTSRYRSVQFSQETTSQLLAACRKQFTSLTAAVQTIFAASLFAHLPSGHFSALYCDGALSFRRWLPVDLVDKDSIGTWVSRYAFEHRFVPRDNSSQSDAIKLFSWEEARKVKATIQKEIDNQGKDSVVGLLKYAGDLNKFSTKNIGKPRTESFEFSNIGTFGHDKHEDGEESSWKVGRVVFSQSADVTGAAIEVSVVTGYDGSLNVGFSWLDGIVEGSMMEGVIGTFKRTVEEVVST
jgi:Alcohol acetyltransferase